MIALDYGEQVHIDKAVADAVHNSKQYAWVGDFTARNRNGRDTFVVWRRKDLPR